VQQFVYARDIAIFHLLVALPEHEFPVVEAPPTSTLYPISPECNAVFFFYRLAEMPTSG
jgi:hypothetical protein